MHTSDKGKILVTGGAGYIGSHTCKMLAERGYEPVVFDSLERGHREAVRWGHLEVGSLSDVSRLNDVFERYQPRAVIHFAAYAYVGESVDRPASYYRNNVVGTMNLVDAMRKYMVEPIVFSSTCAIYGVPSGASIAEEEPQNPINPYGRSKLMMERVLADYTRAYGLRACCLRYFNAAGADPDGDIGELHEPEPHLIPNVLRAGSGRGAVVKVFGDDYPTRDGTCIRDFIHVTDLAQAHCQALEYLQHSSGMHAFNLGSQHGYSVMEIIRTAEKELGLTVPFRIEGRREGDPPVLVADASRAAKELLWVPVNSDMARILRTAMAWEERCIGLEWPA